MLRYLSEHAGQIVSKEELLTALWPRMQVSRGVLKTYVWELRRALGDQQQQPRFIETLPRRGYRWIALLITDSQPLQSSRFKVQGSKFEPVPSLQPLTPNFVGWEAELRFLHDRLEKARRGERQIVFITGEPGIGKTALVETFLQQITDQPHLWIAQDQCIEHYSVGEAYLPLLATLGRLGQQPGKKQLRTALQRYAPTWLGQLPSLLSVNKREQVRQSAQGATWERMLRELAEAMGGLTTKRELVLVLEDLHWSDASTVEWLSFVARWTGQARFFILGTYRPEEVQRNSHPLSAVMQELSPHRLCAELPLKLLTERNVAEYLKTQFSAEVYGHASREALTEAIYQRTEGNPLFIVILVNDLRTQEELTRPDGHWDLQKEDGRLPRVYATLSRILFAMGELSLVQKYAAQGIAAYDAQQHGPYASPVTHDPGVNCLSSQARALWHLGYPDQAVQCGYQALALAQELSHPVSLALALNSVVAFHHWRGE